MALLLRSGSSLFLFRSNVSLNDPSPPLNLKYFKPIVYERGKRKAPFYWAGEKGEEGGLDEDEAEDEGWREEMAS